MKLFIFDDSNPTRGKALMECAHSALGRSSNEAHTVFHGTASGCFRYPDEDTVAPKGGLLFLHATDLKTFVRLHGALAAWGGLVVLYSQGTIDRLEGTYQVRMPLIKGNEVSEEQWKELMLWAQNGAQGDSLPVLLGGMSTEVLVQAFLSGLALAQLHVGAGANGASAESLATSPEARDGESRGVVPQDPVEITYCAALGLVSGTDGWPSWRARLDQHITEHLGSSTAMLCAEFRAAVPEGEDRLIDLITSWKEKLLNRPEIDGP